ncbi:hypothetical protein [Streptomyces rimosus]|uniref:hypothetical protein n=1 Tax=Streptomyces rimosus TaxID=1927 RepID=UPI0037D46763
MREPPQPYALRPTSLSSSGDLDPVLLHRARYAPAATTLSEAPARLPGGAEELEVAEARE